VSVSIRVLAWTGGLINGTQSIMYALAAHVYPAGIRATGVGTAVAIGRVGGIGSSYAGAWALESGPSQLFALLAGTLAVVFAALASVRNHIPSNLAVRAARAMAAAARR
jgi:AAHS family 4-hydroxybenzoate transporter-like MFS transporter